MLQIGLDPYDTGRLSPFGDYGVAPFGPPLSSASLARRPEVEAAILGNSTIQHLNPVRLTRLTNLHFVSLSMQATGPLEQLAVGRWLVRHHDGKSAKSLAVLVIDIDTRWCRGDGTIELTHPFPFWLYSDSDLFYAANLVSLGTFSATARKVKTILGLKPPIWSNGYRDYDDTYNKTDLLGGIRGYELLGQNFAGMQYLKEFLTEVPADTLVILLHPPRYYFSLPASG
ncbi:MAG TPA: hypothetical protein VM782_01505, partial [Stellaceae bacterium]|nr:hypothetical protein [Stellaceae bacterium]